MQKSLVVEGLLVIAIVSAVGYGTVVIRAMSHSDFNVYDEYRKDGGLIQGGEEPKEDGLTGDPAAIEADDHEVEEGIIDPDSENQWKQEQGQAIFGDYSPAATDELDIGTWSEGSREVEIDVGVKEAWQGGYDPGAVPNTENEEDPMARDEWFEAVREQLIHDVPPTEFLEDGETEDVFSGQGATEDSFPDVTEERRIPESGFPYDFGTESGEPYGDSGGDDNIQVDESSEEDTIIEEEYGPEEYVYPEEEAAASTEDGENNGFFQRFLDFITGGEKTSDNNGRRTSVEEESQPKESENTDNADRSGGNRIVNWFKNLFGGF